MKKVFHTVQRNTVMVLIMIVDTLLLRAVDCLVFFFFFFSCAFQQCSTRKQSENELCCSLDLVVGGCILQLNSKNNIYLKKGSITFGLFHILLVLACTALSQCPQKTGGRRPVRQRHC